MNFWKRVRWIGSGVLLALWLLAAIAGSLQRAGDPPKSARPCTTCGL